MSWTLKEFPDAETIRKISELFPVADPLSLEAALRLFRFSAELEKAKDVHFGHYELSGCRFAVLMLLFNSGDAGMISSALAGSLNVTRGNMTGLIDGMERSGLIYREPHPEDGRVFQIHLSKKGRNLLEKVLPDHYRRVSELIGNLNRAEKKLLMGLIEKVRTAIPRFRGAEDGPEAQVDEKRMNPADLRNKSANLRGQ